MGLAIEAIDHLVINVNDLAASAAWYQKVLGMRREDFSPGSGMPARIALKFGGQKINLRPATAARAEWFTAQQASPPEARTSAFSPHRRPHRS
jgi:catechol 2,3-dioxygenase-like lactoylglutathione lyase family enzyme